MDKRKNILLIGGIVLVAVLMLLIIPRLRAGTTAGGETYGAESAGTVEITVDGKLWGKYELGSQQRITVDLGNDEYNVVVIDGNRVYMESSTCRDQLCVDEGEVTPENCATRILGSHIICLPHRLAVTLITNTGTIGILPDA